MVTLEQLYSIYIQHPVVCTDTRKLEDGCIFFALKGENFDGNLFAEDALAKGAAYAVVDDPKLKSSDRLLLVSNVLESMQQLAAHHRKQFDIPVIAIGGSNGKTTTKELVAAVLSSHYPCHYTKGNLNNHIGVPLTLLSMPADTEVAVVEMGTNQPGDIAFLCALASPTHGLLTNIGKEHLEGFGSLEGVKEAEGELYQYLAETNGCVFVNTSEKYLEEMSEQNPKRICYAESDTLRIQDSVIDIRLLDANPYLHFAFLSEKNEQVEVQSQLIGRHNFYNIMTAVALGVYFKVPPEKIKDAIESYLPANNRSQIISRNNTSILLDAYNANPSSMQLALETLYSLKSDKKIAILGDMRELGAASLDEHKAILEFAAGCKFDQLVVVGPEFGSCAPEKYRALHFPDVLSAKSWFDAQSFDHAFILVKASRGIQLEQIIA